MRRTISTAAAIAALLVVSGCASSVRPDTLQTVGTTSTLATAFPTDQALADCENAVKQQVIGASLSAKDQDQHFSTSYSTDTALVEPMPGGLKITFEWTREYEVEVPTISCEWTPDHVKAYVQP